MSAVTTHSDPRPTPRLLVIGLSPPVLETVVGELRALGWTIEGTTRPQSAAEDFDGAAFDLVAIGGGIDDVLRRRLKDAFRARNPALRLVDASAPVAVRQIMEAVEDRPAEPSIDLDAYFARVGHAGPRAPTLETLRAIHLRHPDAIPFEAIDVLLGRGVDLAPAAVEDKLVRRRRGGYCLEQNALLRRVLRRLGFRVEGLAARVRWLAPAGAPVAGRTHMALKVMVDGTPWLADVGFGGCVLPQPLRMDTTEPQPTGHERFRIFPFGPGLLVQAERDGRWLSLYEVFDTPQSAADYDLANWYLTTHPASQFRQNLIVSRTGPEARYALLHGRFTIRRPDGRTERHHLDAAGIESVLTDIFGLPVEPDWRPALARAAQATAMI